MVCFLFIVIPLNAVAAPAHLAAAMAQRGLLKLGKRTPVIALTANALPEDRDMCISAGMDGFVSKPFTKNTLRQAVIHWMVKSASETAR